MARLLTRVSVLAATAAALVLSSGASAPLVAPTASAPLVHLRPTGQVWRFDAVQVVVDVRCAPGSSVADLSLDVVHGDYHATRSGPLAATCDGRRHAVPVLAGSGGPDSVPGDAAVTATLTVTDPATGAPLSAVTDSATVYLRPVAVVRVEVAHLNAGGNAVVDVSMRCEEPWVSQGLGVEVRQRGGRVGGYGSVPDTDVVCDSTWHDYRVKVSSNEPLTAGKAVVAAGSSFLDPWDFDPVCGAGARVWRALTPWGAS